ncbi:MAG: TetR family transcriptional regulator [Rhizobiales bacterium]|nr:TetR family transcriptional regulator [Hyphomicrobiales bacterium]
MTAKSPVTLDKADKIPPRERILAVAGELFYRNGIRAVGVDAIAEAAGTNKMTLYRHFTSKDELVAEYLRRCAKGEASSWDRLQARHPGNPLAQLRAWLNDMFDHIVSGHERGCPLVNAAVELPAKDHPARRVIEECKVAARAKVITLCRAAGLREPDLLADELNLMLEGARVTAQSVGTEGLGARLERMSEALIAAHAPK